MLTCQVVVHCTLAYDRKLPDCGVGGRAAEHRLRRLQPAEVSTGSHSQRLQGKAHS